MSMSKHTAIPKWVSVAVWKRDNEHCIVCGSPHAMPNSHIVRRSQGGRGVPENIVTHCPECHRLYDSYDKEVRKITMDYIMKLYPDWTEEGVTYHRYKEDGSKSDY